MAFAVGYGFGGALVGATGFYHITLAAAARFARSAPERAVTAVTVLGALAGPIFLPLAAILVESLGWRPAVRILGLTAAAGMAAAAALTPRGGASPEGTERPATLHVLTASWRDRAARWKLIAAPVAALGYGILIVHHVPIMVAAGLPLTAAAAYAGARGFVQLAGRVVLVPVVRRIGSSRAIVLTYLAGAAGVVTLAGSRVPAIAVAATVLTGVAIGTGPPLDAVFSAEVFDPGALGTLMGVQQLLAGMVMAVGPLAAGIAFDASGSHATTIVLSLAGFLLGTAAIARVAVAQRAAGPR
jgi:predicted MFS family arabinose efflux permease